MDINCDVAPELVQGHPVSAFHVVLSAAGTDLILDVCKCAVRYPRDRIHFLAFIG